MYRGWETIVNVAQLAWKKPLGKERKVEEEEEAVGEFLKGPVP